jgi:hypothetical protein
MKKIPNFYILGAAKCGTTSLYHYLSVHPSIYMSDNKEPHYFDNHDVFNRGVEAYINDNYSRHTNEVSGEATPTYFSNSDVVIPRMKALYGDEFLNLKFIVIVRDPVDRCWSHYLHMKRIGNEFLSFREAIKQEHSRLKEEPLRWVGYFEDGLYGKHLSLWLQHVQENALLVISSRELGEAPAIVMNRIHKFLGVESIENKDASIRHNIAKSTRYSFINHVVGGEYYCKNTLKKLIPNAARQFFALMIYKLNQSPNVQSKVSPDDSSFLRELYKNDQKLFYRLSGIRFK